MFVRGLLLVLFDRVRVRVRELAAVYRGVRGAWSLGLEAWMVPGAVRYTVRAVHARGGLPGCCES